MVRGVVGTIVVFVAGALLVSWSADSGPYFAHLPATGLLAAVLAVSGFVISKVRHGRPIVAAQSQVSCMLWVAAATAIGTTIVALTSSSVFGELSYYAIVAASGVVMARWCEAPADAAILVAVGALVVVAVLGAITFGLSDTARFEYGPERWLFAVWGVGARWMVAPLDASVAWVAWQVSVRRA